MNYIKQLMEANNIEPFQRFCIGDSDVYFFDDKGNLCKEDGFETEKEYRDKMENLMALLTGDKTITSALLKGLSAALGLKNGNTYDVICVAHGKDLEVPAGAYLGKIKMDFGSSYIHINLPDRCDVKTMVYGLLQGWFIATEDLLATDWEAV